MAAVLVVTPYYNRPSAAGLSAHFRAVAAATDLPVILYDIPVRSGRRIGTALTVELAREVPNIVGVKDATGDVAAAAGVVAETPDGFDVYCGDDSLTLPFASVGGAGIVSVAAHWAGPLFAEMIECHRRGRRGPGQRDQPAPGRVLRLRVHRRVPQPGAGQGRLPGPRAARRPVPPAEPARPRVTSTTRPARSSRGWAGSILHASRLPDPERTGRARRPRASGGSSGKRQRSGGRRRARFGQGHRDQGGGQGKRNQGNWGQGRWQQGRWKPARWKQRRWQRPRPVGTNARAARTQATGRPGNRPSGAAPVRVVFLGGLGEIGRNCACIEVDGRILVLDVGIMFPDPDMPGVDLVLPDFTYLRENAARVDGVILTHGHEDHTGGLAYLLRDFPAPVYGSELTLALARNRVDEAGMADRAQFIPVRDGERRRIGPCDVEFIPVTHSVPHAFATAFHTPQGIILHSGDFKIDLHPVDGRRTDLARMGALAL